MATGSGTCYTWSGDKKIKKIYEPDLLKAELKVYSTEYCFRYDFKYQYDTRRNWISYRYSSIYSRRN